MRWARFVLVLAILYVAAVVVCLVGTLAGAW